jgi:hypothetical protein
MQNAPPGLRPGEARCQNVALGYWFFQPAPTAIANAARLASE